MRTCDHQHGYVQFTLHGALVYSADPDAPCQQSAEIVPDTEQAQAIADAFGDLAARMRARVMSNGQADLWESRV